MGIIFDEKNRLFILDSKNLSCIFHSGALLMNAGLNLTQSNSSDGASILIYLKSVSKIFKKLPFIILHRNSKYECKRKIIM